MRADSTPPSVRRTPAAVKIGLNAVIFGLGVTAKRLLATVLTSGGAFLDERHVLSHEYILSHLFLFPPLLLSLETNSKRTPVRTTTRTRLTPTASRRRSVPSTFPPEEWTPSSCETKSSPRSTTSPSGLLSKYSL